MNNYLSNTTLGEFCDFFNGKAHENNIAEDGQFKLINSKFISSDGQIYKTTNEALFPLRKGDIAFVMSDVPNGKALAKCFLVEEDNKYTLNQRIGCIRTSKININFLFYQLNRNPFLLGFNNGENQTNLRKGDILKCPLWIPSEQEQKRIVAILDEAFAGISQATANTEKNLANVRELFESYVSTIFLTQNGWITGSLGSFCSFIATGPFGSMLHKSDYVTDGVPLVNPINLVNGEIVPDSSKLISEETKKNLDRYVLKKNDVVIGRRGEIGRCAVIREHQNGWVCGTGCFFIRPKPSLNSDFLAHLLRSDYYSSLLEAAATGATMKNLSNQTLSNLTISIPSAEAQVKILDKINFLVEYKDNLQFIYQQKLQSLAELKQSLLQKAFSGELTANNVDKLVNP